MCALEVYERSLPLVAHPTLQRRRIITTYASLQKTSALCVRATYIAFVIIESAGVAQSLP